MPIEDHWRQQISWTEQVESWTLRWEITIVGIVEPKLVNHSNISHLCTHTFYQFCFSR